MKYLVLSLVYYVASLHKDSELRLGQIEIPKSMRIKNEFLYLLNKDTYPERSVAYYADQLKVSASYLNSTMKKLTGKSPLDWINDNSVKAARLLLCGGSDSIDDIAHDLHFADGATFAKFYKRETGEAPTVFRKRMNTQQA